MTAWFAPQFAELRRRCCAGGEEAFLCSLSRCRAWEARGGKTRAYFAKTADDRYIVKQLQASEKKSFQEIAPAYFRYLATCMRRGAPTCLAKIMGVFTVRPSPAPASTTLPSLPTTPATLLPARTEMGDGRPTSTAVGGERERHSHQQRTINQLRGVLVQVTVRPMNAKEVPMDILVMENIFYNRELFPIYDLKGSERARLARDDPSDPTRVLLDQNLKQSNLNDPILVRPPLHHTAPDPEHERCDCSSRGKKQGQWVACCRSPREAAVRDAQSVQLQALPARCR